MSDDGSKKLFDALDAASVKMLQLLDPDAVEEDEETGDPNPVSAATKVKIFAAVTEYAALRAAKEPPKLEKGRFNGLRDRFHGDEAPGGARRRKPRASSGGAE